MADIWIEIPDWGTMGSALALNMAEKGSDVAGLEPLRATARKRSWRGGRFGTHA